MRELLLLAALVATTAVQAADVQKPMTPQDRAKLQAACPDYSTYSKYALQ